MKEKTENLYAEKDDSEKDINKRENAQKFIKYAINVGAIQFGEFELKSKRVSPYFFNSGLFTSGKATERLAKAYAHAIIESGVEFDGLFGPAYKGIPLAATVAMALAQEGVDVPWYADRKEMKDHGEEGWFVTSVPQGRVLIIDDAVTTAKTKIEAAELLESVGAEVAGVVIAFDREERGTDTELSAVQSLKQELDVPIITIATLHDLTTSLFGRANTTVIAKHNKTGEELRVLDITIPLAQYKQEHGVNDT